MPDNKEISHQSFTPEDIFKGVESNIASYIKDSLKAEMKDFPGLDEFVSRKMDDALIPSEEILIGETALTVAQYCQKNKITKEPADEGEEYPGRSKTDLMAEVIEAEDLLQPEDKNRIYQMLQEDLEEHPDLAGFIVKMMNKSVSLKEANLIGRTARVVYKIFRYPFSDNN